MAKRTLSMRKQIILAEMEAAVPRPSLRDRAVLSLPLPGQVATLLIKLPITLTDIEFLHRNIDQLKAVLEAEQVSQEADIIDSD